MESLLATSFVLITIITLLIFYFGIGKNKKILFSFLVWQLIIEILNYYDIFKSNPKIFPFFIIVTIVIIYKLTSKIKASEIDLKILTIIHFVRVPVEFVLYGLFLEKRIPVLMTFKGWNFDIIMGLSSVFVWLYLIRNQGHFNVIFLKFWNYTGIAFLLFIVGIGILSSPLPIQQLAFDQPNVAILEFPFTYLATCVVPLVVFSHILVLKKTKNI